MFGFSKKTDETAQPPQAPVEELPKGYTPKKGTATPSRKVAQANRRRPLVADKTKLTKEEAKARKAQERAENDREWRRQQEAMRTGDEIHMPYQHRGKVRRFGRDYIDAAAPLSTWFMPLAVLLVPLMFVSARYPAFSFYTTIGFYAVFLLMLAHALIVVTKAKRLAEFKFGAGSIPRGFTWQMLGRAFYLRRWRLPAPQVARGEYPEGARKDDVSRMRAAKKQIKKMGI